MVNSDRTLLTQAEYARHRGVSRAAVKKAVDTGRITLVDGNKIDRDRADLDWENRTNRKQQRQPKPAGPSESAASQRKTFIPPDEGGVEPLALAQARKETALADLREIEIAIRRGELISAAAVDAKWSEVGTRTKDEMLSVPTRVVNRLPDEWRREVNAIVTEEVMRALNAVSVAFMPKG